MLDQTRFRRGLASVGWILEHDLTPRVPISALTRYARTQIRWTQKPEPFEVEWIEIIPAEVTLGRITSETRTARLIAKPGRGSVINSHYCDLGDYQEMALLYHLLGPGDVFVDVGANVGVYSVLAAAAGARVVAFEPVPDTGEGFREHIALNELGDLVELRTTALGAQTATAMISTASGELNRILTNRSNQSAIKVPVSTLDRETSQHPPTAVKIDVEGFEAEVIAGASTTLAAETTLALVVELNGRNQAYGESDETVHGLITSAGFDPVQYDPAKRLMTKVDSWRTDHLNTIYARDIASVHDRLMGSPPLRVRGREI